jgi:predicted DNA-binding protein
MEREEKEKEVYYQIRIDKETKERFMSFCKSKGYNSSAIVRNMIIEWLDKKESANASR